MKKTLFTLLMLVYSTLTFSQNQTPAETTEGDNCYQKYAMIFEKRGAFDVEDGTYNDVIISVRKGSSANCFNGKVDVVKGIVTNIHFKFSDGTFEKLERKYKNDPTHIGIVNGISQTLVTKDEELINILFVKKIKPKKKEYEKAPEPSINDY